jgi:Kef-type K+ transport system membrane component KefB
MIPLNLLIYLGTAIILGFIIGRTTHWLKLTAIVGYIVAGIILGPVMGLIMEGTLSNFTINSIVDITLGLVGFIIGVGFTKDFIKRYGETAIIIAIIESVITLIIISFGIYIFTLNLNLSLILGVIGLATAPAGTVAAIRMCKGRGELSRLTVAIVGIDDGIAIILFVIVITFVRGNMGGSQSLFEIIKIPLIEIGGAILIGAIIGLCLSYITKFVKHREDIFIITIGLLLLCIGISEAIKASSILACMVFGITLINFEPRIGRIGNSVIEGIVPPIFVLFFALAGLELSLQYSWFVKYGLISIIGILIVYIVYRIIGKLLGGLVAGKISKLSKKTQKYLGFALLSQAGVNIGLAILVSNELSSLPGGKSIGILVITLVTITTIIFEILGPLGVKFALVEAEEAFD